MTTPHLHVQSGIPPLPKRLQVSKSQGMRADLPIGEFTMEETFQFSWYQPVREVELTVSRPISPWGTATFIRAEASADAAHAYVAKVAQAMDDDLRSSLLRGIGMFKFPLGTGDVDDSYES